MTASLTVSVSGDTPAEVATRLRALADALTQQSASVPATNNNGGGPPAVHSSPAPRVCSVHATPLRFDSWTAKSGRHSVRRCSCR